MRAALLVLLLLMSTLPLHHASAETQPGLTCPETASLVPGQPMAVPVLQHGLEPYALSITNTSLVEVGALTNTTVGGNQSWTVTLTAALNAPSGHVDLPINLSDGSTALATCTIDVWIRPASALVLGVSGESTLTVNEGVTTQVAVNLTNVGS